MYSAVSVCLLANLPRSGFSSAVCNQRPILSFPASPFHVVSAAFYAPVTAITRATTMSLLAPFPNFFLLLLSCFVMSLYYDTCATLTLLAAARNGGWWTRNDLPNELQLHLIWITEWLNNNNNNKNKEKRPSTEDAVKRAFPDWTSTGFVVIISLPAWPAFLPRRSACLVSTHELSYLVNKLSALHSFLVVCLTSTSTFLPPSSCMRTFTLSFIWGVILLAMKSAQ